MVKLWSRVSKLRFIEYDIENMVWLGAEDLLNFHCNVACWKWLMKWEMLYTNDLLVMKTICHWNNLNLISADDTLFRKDVRDHVHDHSNTSPSTEVNSFLMIPFFDRFIKPSVWLYCGHKQANNPWSARGKTKADQKENQLSFVTTEKRNRTTVVLILAAIYTQHY